MNINRDEALRAQSLAESLMQKSDFTSARKLAIKAHSMDSTLENISHMTMVCDVHCAAAKEKMLSNNEMDWYGILQVDMNANDVIIKKQYRKLALLLHPDKNKLPGAEAAFKLIGEAQRTLLDKGKRMVYDMKRKSSVRPAPPPPYRSQRVPCDDPPPTWQTSEYMRSVYEGVRPENMMHRPRPPRKRAGFGQRSTFWTSCFFCGSRYEYGREYIKRGVSCQSCKKLFVAFEVPFVPPQGSCSYNHQNTSSFPQQSQRACPPEPHRRTDDPATAFTGKAAASTAENNKGKRKRERKDMDESSESSDSGSSSESEDDETMAAGEDMGSSGGKEPRRSVRSKRHVSYNECLSDDDDGDFGNDIGENVDTEKEEEKQTHEDHHHHQATETLNSEEKIEEDSLDDSSLGGEAGEANVISCDDPEFSDFDKLREKSCFDKGQVWALYDEGEGMPRFYALIREVTTSPNFSVKYVWLEAGEDETRDLPVSVGSYVRGEEEAKTNSSDLFSHLVQSKTRRNAKNFTVFPGRGETWALFKNWDMDLSSDSPREYEFVEILSDYAEGGMISVGFLFKVEGFKYVYSPMPEEEADTFEIQHHEFFRFSHRVPSFRLKGTEGRGVLEGWYELDPAALPVPGSQNIPGEDHQSPPSGSSC